MVSTSGCLEQAICLSQREKMICTVKSDVIYCMRWRYGFLDDGAVLGLEELLIASFSIAKSRVTSLAKWEFQVLVSQKVSIK